MICIICSGFWLPFQDGKKPKSLKHGNNKWNIQLQTVACLWECDSGDLPFPDEKKIKSLKHGNNNIQLQTVAFLWECDSEDCMSSDLLSAIYLFFASFVHI